MKGQWWLTTQQPFDKGPRLFPGRKRGIGGGGWVGPLTSWQGWLHVYLTLRRSDSPNTTFVFQGWQGAGQISPHTWPPLAGSPLSVVWWLGFFLPQKIPKQFSFVGMMVPFVQRERDNGLIWSYNLHLMISSQQPFDTNCCQFQHTFETLRIFSLLLKDFFICWDAAVHCSYGSFEYETNWATKKTSHVPLYWLFDRGLLQSPYNCVV